MREGDFNHVLALSATIKISGHCLKMRVRKKEEANIRRIETKPRYP